MAQTSLALLLSCARHGGALLLALVVVTGCSDEPPAWERLKSNPDVVFKKDKLARMVSATSYANGVKNGVAERYYTTGDVASRKYYVDGLEHGKATYYHRSGQISVEVEFVEGKPHGKYRAYHQTGELLREKTFEHGLPIGQATSYYVNGVVQTVENFKQGKLHGQRDYFDEFGSILYRDTYILGVLVDKTYPLSDQEIEADTD